MDAQIYLLNNIVTFLSMSELLSNDSSLKFFIIILKAYGLTNSRHVTKQD
jgi:hypothetical protein